MRKMINEVNKPITEIGYKNKTGYIEVVNVTNTNWVSLRSDSNGDGLSQIYYEDVPKLIQALQEALIVHQARG